MITKQEALRIADEHVNNGRSGPYTGDERRVIDDEATIERDIGWMFIYNRAEYFRTGELRDGLVGNGPILVRREDGAVIEFFSSFTKERALAAYEANPDKFPPATSRS